MKIEKIFCIVTLTCLFILPLHAQKMRLVSGNFKALKGQKTIDIEYNYDDMRVGKFVDEADYVSKKVADYNEDDPGRGDNWAKAWVADRSDRFEPKFEELLNKNIEKINLHASQEEDEAAYTLIVHTTFTEPGWNAYVMKKPASINVTVTLVKSDDPTKVLGKATITGSPGRTFGSSDLDTGVRIAEAYAKAGKEFGKFLMKLMK